MRDFLLIAWLATLAADRIDFFAGQGPFLLTPFLVLSPVVIGVETLRLIGNGGRLRIPRGAGRYTLAVTALLGLALLSVMFSLEIGLAAKRYALLLIQVVTTLLVVVFLNNRARPDRILVRGAYAGLSVALAFNAIQVGIWLSGGAATPGGPGKLLFLEPWMYGPWVPRLSGPAIDMNRGGFMALVYMFLLLRFANPSKLRTAFLVLGLFSVVATLSRSTMLALGVTAALLFVQQRSISVTPRALFSGSVAVAGVAGLLLVFTDTVVQVAEFLAPALALRLLGDGSSSIHFALLQYGAEVGTESVKNALLGVGFGNSFAVLEQFFPGDKYGNFHSLYMSLWVETGVISLCVGLFLLIYPFLRSGSYRALLGGIIAFNLFYQATLEPIFWFSLAAAWTELGAASPAPDGEPEPEEWYPAKPVRAVLPA